MMDFSKVINYKINILIDLMLTDGVSPSDLVNNIFDDIYSRISYYKKDSNIVGELEFYDINDNDKLVKLIYTYSNDKKVLRIEEQVRNETTILWDRSMREKELISEIVCLLKKVYSPKQLITFIEALPEQLKYSINKEIDCIA